MRVAVLLCLCAALLFGQAVDTGILGTVTDPSGAVIVGAGVTITQPTTGTVHNVQTNLSGIYEVRYLLPGEWVVEVRMAGFQSQKSAPITLQVGQLARMDFALQVGEVTQEVVVTAQGVLLETQSGVVGDVVTSEKIVNLPLNGRSFVALGNLTPGVIASGGAFRADGSRSMYQQISFDGVTAVRNREYSVRMFPNIDAVQEFKVQSSNYSAEYGGHAGANVQLQLRNGTNELHGAAFDYLRNDILDARAYFSPAPNPKPELRRNQFGGVVTGPIKRDRIFFMGSYEGLRQRQQSQATTSVFTQAMRNGDFTGFGTITDPMNNNAPFSNSTIPSSRINSVALNIINQYTMMPNLPGNTNNFGGVSLSSTTQDQYMGRIDYNINGNNQVFGHYVYQGANTPSVNVDPKFGSAPTTRNQSVGFQYLHTFSGTKLNEFRFGYNRGGAEQFSTRMGTGFTAAKDLGIQGLLVGGPGGRVLQDFENGFPSISITNYVGMGDSTGGAAIDHSRSYQFLDNFSLIKGRHTIKFGGDVRKLVGDANSNNTPFGNIVFTRDITNVAAAAYLLGFPKNTQTPEGITVSGIRAWRIGPYFQDDWKANDRLTLNLGIRWDLNLLPKDIFGVSRTLRFDLDPKGPVVWPPLYSSQDLWIKEHRHFAPRLGFAYRLRNTWVVRGGYGIFTMANHFDNINTLATNPPGASFQLVNANVNPVATIQNPFPAALVPNPLIYNITSVEPDRRHPDGYFQNWNLSMGHQFSQNDTLEVRYAGSKATHLDSSVLNWNSPQPDPKAATDPATLQSRRPYPAYGRIRMWDTGGNSNYHSMQTRFEHRVGYGLSLTVAHTWSHLIDDQGGGTNANRAKSQNPRCLRCNMRADSADDQRHAIVIGYVWQIPYGANLKSIQGAVLRGWMLGGLYTFRTGSHLFVDQDGDTLNIDPSGPVTSTSYNEIRPDLVYGQTPYLPADQRSLNRWFNTAAFTRATVTYGTSPRNPLDGPGTRTWDMSMSKNFKIYEQKRIEFRWEAFNWWNTPQLGNPNTTLGNSNFGRITSASGSRSMQVALKFAF
jgi:hypothetical protein